MLLGILGQKTVLSFHLQSLGVTQSRHRRPAATDPAEIGRWTITPMRTMAIMMYHHYAIDFAHATSSSEAKFAFWRGVTGPPFVMSSLLAELVSGRIARRGARCEQ
jgi:hypothetical protein